MRYIPYFILFILSACGEPTALSPVGKADEDSTVFTRTTTFERDHLKRDATTIPTNQRDPDSYIYDWEVDEANFTERAPRVNIQPINRDSSSHASPISYEVTATNRPPIFDSECLKAENPLSCSNEALKSFVQSIVETFEESEVDFVRDYDIVTFIVDKKGKVLGDVFIAPNEKLCADCNKAAVRVVSKMNKWVPAIRNGEQVSVRVQVPIRYN
jgi:hypothetical protein